jgi:hypothetical protein
MENKTLYWLIGLFLFWTGFCVCFGIEQGRNQSIESKVKCVAVYAGDTNENTTR